MWPARWTRTGDELALLLWHWRGARAEVSEYSHQHGQLLIRFFRDAPHTSRSMYLLCKDCRTVQFQSYWLDMEVRVDWKSDSSIHSVSDGNRLRVECGAVVAAESEALISLRDSPS